MLAFIGPALSLVAFAAPTTLSAQDGANAPEQEAVLPPVDQLPQQEATSIRCASAIALVVRWQKDGLRRARLWPKIEETKGREFFVRTAVALMDRYSVTDRQQIEDYLYGETSRINVMSEDDLNDMAPTCFALYSAFNA